MSGNSKLFWKEVSNVNGGKVKSCRRIKNGNEKLALGKDKVKICIIWILKSNSHV